LSRDEWKKILAGVGIAGLIAGASMGGIGCAKKAHGS
jgi:radical SAM modification target selenobiotic family peptide